jgi:hypothetical protein
MVNNVFKDLFGSVDADIHSSSPEVQARKIDTICSIVG